MDQAQAKEMIERAGLTAAARGDLPKVQELLEAQPELVEAMNSLEPKTGEETPQRAAAAKRQVEILKYFLAKGVKPELFMACALGMVDLVDAYLTAHPKDVDAKGAHGIGLMVHANDPEMVELLIKHGSDATLALQQLSWSGRVELMQVAIKHGATVDPADVGRRPLHIAAKQGHLAAVELLIKLGADVHSRSKGADWERKTPLGLALMGNHMEVVEVIKKRIAELPPQPAAAGPRGARPAGRFPPRRRL